MRSGDRHVYAARTRFIPNDVLGLFDKHSLAGRCRFGGNVRPTVRVDVGARMRGMWR